MLITLIEVVGCENPDCRDFGKVAYTGREMRPYYCQICGKTSKPRAVDGDLAASPQRYKEYLRRMIARTS